MVAPATTSPSPSESAPAEQQINGEELLAWRRAELQRGGSGTQLDWLLWMQAGLSWQELQQLRLHPERLATLRSPLATLSQLWRRHCQEQIPLQYLVGCCPWRDLDLRVGPGVLIPRQETELLVDLAVSLQSSGLCPEPHLWADLGTGSGCLAMALAACWPRSQGFAVERSPEALAQARRNVQQRGLMDRLQVLEGDWWEPLKPHWGHLDLVVSNPPYIPTAVWAELQPVVREHEPRQALDGGADGLEAMRRIAAGATAALAAGGWLLLEHHVDQSAAVLELLHKAGLEDLQAHRDLEGRDRFVVGRRPLTS